MECFSLPFSPLCRRHAQEMKSTTCLFIHLRLLLILNKWMNDYFQNRRTDKEQATALHCFVEWPTQLSGQVSLSFPELFPEILREALVSNFTSSHFLKGEVDWLRGTECISHRRWGMVTFLKTQGTRIVLQIPTAFLSLNKGSKTLALMRVVCNRAGVGGEATPFLGIAVPREGVKSCYLQKNLLWLWASWTTLLRFQRPMTLILFTSNY